MRVVVNGDGGGVCWRRGGWRRGRRGGRRRLSARLMGVVGVVDDHVDVAGGVIHGEEGRKTRRGGGGSYLIRQYSGGWGGRDGRLAMSEVRRMRILDSGGPVDDWACGLVQRIGAAFCLSFRPTPLARPLPDTMSNSRPHCFLRPRCLVSDHDHARMLLVVIPALRRPGMRP